MICGLGLVTLLSIIIGILSAAVIGLIAATAVEATKTTTCNSTTGLSGGSSPAGGLPTSTSSAPASSATLATDAGCSSKAINNTNYQAISNNGQNFTFFCNADLPSHDQLTVISPSFEACIEACADWNGRVVQNGAQNCTGVAFVPSWYNFTGAVAARAGDGAGNCFLKYDSTEANLSGTHGVPVDAAIALW